MFTLADRFLLSRPIPETDFDLRFRRIDGERDARVIYFLPWHTSYRVAHRLGLLPLSFVACYEMPASIVSAEPKASVDAVSALLEDALEVLDRRSPPSSLSIVGYSVGVFPAAALAARLGARLFAVAAADRGDLMIWESRAALPIKQRAIDRGYGVDLFTAAFAGRNPVELLDRIGSDSVFVSGSLDPFVPQQRRHAFADAIMQSKRRHRLIEVDRGHLGTMFASRKIQRHLLGTAAFSPGRAATRANTMNNTYGA